MSNVIETSSDWDVLLQFLPLGWEEKARELGALTRQRKIPSAESLLRLLLMHLADGSSLRETTTRAKLAGIAFISDVALLKRLRSSSAWLQWIAVNLLEQLGGPVTKPAWLAAYNVRIVDASIITEPGMTGSEWRLHYSMELFGLNCDYLEVTPNTTGETLINFPVRRGDLIIGDRAYGSKSGMDYMLSNGANFLLRIRNKAMKLQSPEGAGINLLEEFGDLQVGVARDISVCYERTPGNWEPLRICVVRKSDEAAKEAIRKAKRIQSKKQRSMDAETIALHRYVFIATSIPAEVLDAKQALELYRLRWQIEVAFKRLKSVLGLGHLPKTDPVSARAWLYGKLAVALLAHAIVSKGRLFSPWGYPLR
jgi:hypothetical protein